MEGESPSDLSVCSEVEDNNSCRNERRPWRTEDPGVERSAPVRMLDQVAWQKWLSSVQAISTMEPHSPSISLTATHSGAIPSTCWPPQAAKGWSITYSQDIAAED
eukprot:CAMPEP_0194767552 /NCGR_PEP_ID=MMETSP0323_2-20130528/36347_1 /TAXON_ID=2866 ORGANISM="Crypthecodinium cohnii, Strain Seligo" /NCGR_SAMPLE_ID=MMETSP0323_2 /ASSEMBLY_ACC=CAM_ASM_000346 /LENGTH=104 /DNA_ID=CAMNT_0039699361 /DNA_START=96 /DNA_END=410 /DNA_ORIENTATION=-